MKTMKKFLLIGFLTVLLALSACTTPATPEDTNPESNFPTNENQIEDEPIVPILEPINYQAVVDRLSMVTTNYVSVPADEFGDESSYNRVPGSSAFMAATEVVLNYQPSNLLEGREIDMTIVDLTSEKTVYKGTLLEGEHPYKVLLEADHAGFAPRFEVCFDEGETCVQMRATNVDNAFSTNVDSISVNIGRGEATKPVIVTNDGNTYLTIFVNYPEGSDFEVTTDEQVFTLEPQEEKIVMFEASGSKSIGKEIATIYALPNSCDVSQDCAESGKIRQEITVSFN